MNEIKSTKIISKNLPQSALKLRLVVNMVRGMSVPKAVDILKFTNKKGSLLVTRAINAAVASAGEKFGVDADSLVISHISVDEVTPLKRIRFSSRARVSRITKRRSNINLEVSTSK